MFAGDRSAGGDAQLENMRRKRLGRFFLSRDAPVVKNEGMEITVAGVKHIGDAQAGFPAETLNFAHHPRRRRSRISNAPFERQISFTSIIRASTSATGPSSSTRSKPPQLG